MVQQDQSLLMKMVVYLAGNGTIEGAKAAGLENVRIIESDGKEIIAIKRTGLTEDQKVGLASS